MVLTVRKPRINKENKYPGVGIWNWETRTLQGSADRLAGMGRIPGNIDKLVVHVHNPDDLYAVLTNERTRTVRDLTIIYHGGTYNYSNLKQALQDCPSRKLDRMVVTSEPAVVIPPWRVEALKKLYRPLRDATLNVLGQIIPPGERPKEDRVESGWYRYTDGCVATNTLSLPWVQENILDEHPHTLIVDCDDQFHLTTLQAIDERFEVLERLELLNVSTVIEYMLKFIQGLKLRSLSELRITGEDIGPQMRKAIQARLPHVSLMVN